MLPDVKSLDSFFVFDNVSLLKIIHGIFYHILRYLSTIIYK